MVRWLLDLVAVALLTAVAGAALFTLDGPVRVVLVLPLILFFPGYAFLSALFPEESGLGRSRRGRQPWGSPRRRGRDRGKQSGEREMLLGNIERFVLSIALSLALVALVVFGLNFTVGFETRRIGIMLIGFTGSMIIFAVARRITLPPQERYTVEITTDGVPMDAGFLGLFGISLLVLAASAGAFALMDPIEDAGPGISAITENESTSNTTWKAAEKNIINGEPVKLLVQNNGEQTEQYTLVVARDGSELERFTPTIKAGGEKRIDYNPPDDGKWLQLYLYEGDAPENPSPESADILARYSLSQPGGNGEQEEDEEQESISAPAFLTPAGSI